MSKQHYPERPLIPMMLDTGQQRPVHCWGICTRAVTTCNPNPPIRRGRERERGEIIEWETKGLKDKIQDRDVQKELDCSRYSLMVVDAPAPLPLKRRRRLTNVDPMEFEAAKVFFFQNCSFLSDLKL